LAMPWQLKEGLERFRKEKRKPRPIAETLPAINIVELPIPRDSNIRTLPNISFKYPFLASARLTWDAAEFNYPALHRGKPGRKQTFEVYPVRVGYGTRYYFRCDCGKRAAKLYLHNAELACKHCHRVRMASQAITRRARPILQAARLESFLSNKPRLRQAQERLRKRLGDKIMTAQGAYNTRAKSLWAERS